MRRHLIILGASLAALLVSLAVTAATIAEARFMLRGIEQATSVGVLPEWSPRLGVNADLRLYLGDDLNTTLDQMRAAHITWVRQIVPWASVEATPGQLDWSAWDRVFAPFAADNRLRLVAVLQGAPAWAADSSAVTVDTAPPAEDADFAAFASAFAVRYGTFIDYYQIWDEPNLESGWGGLEPRPAQYLGLLTAAYEAIHAADPRATVIAAGLAPTTETGPRNLNDAAYLEDLLALGGAEAMDAAAGKPFGFDTAPDDRTVSPQVLNFSRLILLREVLIRYGLGDMPLWATGWGWNSLPERWSGAPSIWGSVSADQQAAYTVSALDRVEREWPWVGGMTLHLWQPDALSDDPQWGFAMIDSGGQPTPLYAALAARLPAAGARNALFAAANPWARYSGAWRFGPLGADIGDQQDSQAVFTFEGSEIALRLRQDDFVAYLFAEVDGLPANALPRDGGGNAYIVLTSGTRQPETSLVTVARNLTNGPHELRLIADRGWDRWALAGFAVSSGNPADPYWQQLAVGVVTALIAVAAAVVSASQLDWRGLRHYTSRLWRLLGAGGQLALSAAAALALMLGMLFSFGTLLPDLMRRDLAAYGLSAGALLLLILSPALLVSLVATAALLLVFFHRPLIGLMLVVFSAPFFLFPVELYRFAFPLSELLLLILSVAWLVRQVVNWAGTRKGRNTYRWSLRLNVLDAAVAMYALLGVIAMFNSALRGPALTELRVLFIEPAIFYLILRTTCRDRHSLLSLADALIAGAATVAVIGLAQYALGQSVVIAEGGAGRLASVYGSPNNAALFLERALPFALAMALVRFDGRRRVLAGVTFAVMCGALVLTLSAGGLFLGLPAAMATVLLLRYGRRGVILLGGAALALGTALAIAMQSERFARLADFSAGTSFFRVRVWQSAVRMIEDYPITGIGLDQFLYAYRGHYILPDAWQEPDLSHPHNIALDFWLRLGFLGALLLVLTQIAFWARSLRLWWAARLNDPVRVALLIGAMGSMAGLLAHGMVDNSVFVSDLALVFMLLLGIPASLSLPEATAQTNGPGA